MSPQRHLFPGWSTASGLAVLLLAGLLPPAAARESACGAPNAFADPPTPPRAAFTDITSKCGLAQPRGTNVADPLLDYLGSGCAFVDFDGDGDEDILLTQAGEVGSAQRSAILLYANHGNGTFRDVTEGSGLECSFKAFGLAAADYDNDGHRDLFVTGLGQQRLFRNLGKGKFQDVTSMAGVADEHNRWTTSACWLDYDNDGWLDLFVGSYGSPPSESSLDAALAGGGLTLYRNEQTRFRDVSVPAGVRPPSAAAAAGRSLAIAAVDLDDNGWIDVIVANDGRPNWVFQNKGNGTFIEAAAAAGLACDSGGNVPRSRSIDVAWCRDDACPSVVFGTASGLGLYTRPSRMVPFRDEAPAEGLAGATRTRSLFGVLFFDYDLDGWPDLLAANEEASEPAQLFWNCGPQGSFSYQPAPTSPGRSDFSARGVAYADIDGDHDLDLLFTKPNGAPVLLRNDANGHRSIRIKLIGSRSPRDAIGAKVTLRNPRRVWRAQVNPGRGYLSQSELTLTIGYRRVPPHEMEVQWPSGYAQKLRLRSGERALTVVEPLKTRLADNGH